MGRRLGCGLILPLAAAGGLWGQTPLIVGFPANFDAFNTTGAPVNGFEIEADGIQQQDVTRVFGGPWVAAQGCVIRYCQGTIIPFTGGVYIGWASPWDTNTQQFTLSTPVHNGSFRAGESCWTGGLGAAYPAAGCARSTPRLLHRRWSRRPRPNTAIRSGARSTNWSRRPKWI